MPTDAHRARCFLSRLLRDHTTDELREQLKPKTQEPAPRVSRDPHMSAEAVDRRWQVFAAQPESRAALLDPQTLGQMECYQHNIENFIGCVKLPVGVAGPLRVNGLFAQGDYYIPLATTEATLVASYSRGAQLISEAGGCTAMLINEGMSRAPPVSLSPRWERPASSLCGPCPTWSSSSARPRAPRATANSSTCGPRSRETTSI